MRRRLRDESGNTLALFPAAVMVMFVLASMAIDAALTFSAQRRLADIASAAANDASSAVAESVYFDPDDPRFAIDPAQAATRVQQTLANRPDADELRATCPDVDVSGDTVTVTCTGTVRQLISPARFLGVTDRDIRARATARAVRG